MANRAEIIRLIAQLSNDGPTARTSAARFLGKQRDQSAVRPLTAALTDQERSVRHQAVVALGLLADPSVASHLESMLDDPNVDIRVSAIRSLADAGASSSIPKLALLQTTAKPKYAPQPRRQFDDCNPIHQARTDRPRSKTMPSRKMRNPHQARI